MYTDTYTHICKQIVAKSLTAQQPGSCPQALWITTHGQQVALFVGEDFTPLQSQCIIQPRGQLRSKVQQSSTDHC